MTRRLVAAVCGLTVACAVSSCSTAAPSPAQRPFEPPQVGRFASPNPGSVNTFWLPGPQGLVVIDTGRNVAGGHRAAAQMRATGRPVAAIVITHPHPDHIGGAGALHEEEPAAPIYASETTIEWIRSDPLKFYPLARRDDPDFPSERTIPSRVVDPNATLELGGLRLETAEFGPGESATATVYYEPATRALFTGDLVGNRVTPALLEGHTCPWLADLDRLSARFPDALTIYPGHGDPGPAAALIGEQRDYLRTFRSVVRPAVAPESPGGADITPTEHRAIATELDGHYPNYPRVAALPNLQEVNISAVGAELRSENPASLPSPCRE